MQKMEFDGFSPVAISFLTELRDNNKRQWFAAHKATYENEIKRPAAQFCAQMTAGLQSLTGIAHLAKIFRINRDVRFSKDKSPYNSHLHISFKPAEASATAPAFMFGLAPRYCTLGCGVFEFDRTMLGLFRDEIAGPRGEQWNAIVSQLENDGLRLSEPSLKRVPPGYPPVHAQADLLKHKGLIAWLDLDGPDAATRSDIVPSCIAGYARMRPLFDALMALRS